MEYNVQKGEIYMNREMNNLDKFVYDFVKLLDGKYVLVSGYVSIITGRARATEDVDLILPKMEFSYFSNLWGVFEENGFECLNTSDVKEGFEMLEDHAIRFARKGKPIPNMEFKVVKDELGMYSLNHRVKLFIRDKMFFVSTIEMQIAYKRYYLGSPKDMEDALHLEELFKEKIDYKKLKELKDLVMRVKENE